MADKRPRQKVFNYVNWDSLYTPKETKLTETQPLAVETQDNLSFNYDPFEVINQENRRQNALTLLKPPQTNGNGTQRPIETDSGISNVLTQKREFKPTDTISVSESTKQPLGEPKKFTPNSNLNVPMSDFEADLTVLQQMGDKVKTQEDADNFNLKLAEVKKKYPTLNLPQEVTERNLQFGFPQVKIPEIKYSDKKLGKMNDKERADAYQLLTRSIMSGKPITEVSKEDDLRGTQLGRILGSFGQGVLSTGAGIAGFQEYIGKKLGAEGYENVNKAIKENINGWVREITPSNPNFMEQFASGLGSYSVFLPMGIGTMKLSEALLKISPKIANWFGASAMTTLESMMEAGSVYDESGDSAAAEKTFFNNMLLIGITNKYGIFNDNIKNQILKALTSASMEGIQEGAQEVISNGSQGKNIDWSNVFASTGIGAILGAGGSMVYENATHGDELEKDIKKSLKKITLSKQEIDQVALSELSPKQEQQLTTTQTSRKDLSRGLYTPDQSTLQGTMSLEELLGKEFETQPQQGLTQERNVLELAAPTEQQRFETVQEEQKLRPPIEMRTRKQPTIEDEIQKAVERKQKILDIQQKKIDKKNDTDLYSELSAKYYHSQRKKRLIDEADFLDIAKNINTPEVRTKAEDLFRRIQEQNKRFTDSNVLSLENLSKRIFKTKDVNSLTDDQQKQLLFEFNEMKKNGIKNFMELGQDDIKNIREQVNQRKELEQQNRQKELEDAENAIRIKRTEEEISRITETRENIEEGRGRMGRGEQGIELAGEEGIPEGTKTEEEGRTPQEVAKAQEEIKQIIEDGGGKFDGIQKIDGEGKFVLATDPETKSTYYFPIEGLTKEAVEKKLSEKRKEFERAIVTKAGGEEVSIGIKNIKIGDEFVSKLDGHKYKIERMGETPLGGVYDYKDLTTKEKFRGNIKELEKKGIISKDRIVEQTGGETKVESPVSKVEKQPYDERLNEKFRHHTWYQDLRVGAYKTKADALSELAKNNDIALTKKEKFSGSELTGKSEGFDYYLEGEGGRYKLKDYELEYYIKERNKNNRRISEEVLKDYPDLQKTSSQIAEEKTAENVKIDRKTIAKEYAKTLKEEPEVLEKLFVIGDLLQKQKFLTYNELVKIDPDGLLNETNEYVKEIGKVDAEWVLGERGKEVYDKLKARQETRLAVKRGEDLFPESAGIPEEEFLNQPKFKEEISEQEASDIEAIEQQAEAIIEEEEPNLTDQDKSENIEQIDTLVNEIDEKLKLLGYYSAEGETEKDITEYGSKMPEKKFKKDLTKFANELKKGLGYEDHFDKKGKKNTVDTNIAPIGGDGTIILWKPNSDYGVYISVSTRRGDRGKVDEFDRADDLIISGLGWGEDRFMWRVTTKQDVYTGLSNQWVKNDITAGEFARMIKQAVDRAEREGIKKQEPKIGTVEEQVKQIKDLASEKKNVSTEKPKAEPKNKVTVKENDRGGIDIFFTEKPSDAILSKLKLSSFRWTNQGGGHWWAMRTDKRLELANQIKKEVEGTKEVPTEQKPELKTETKWQTIDERKNIAFGLGQKAFDKGEQRLPNDEVYKLTLNLSSPDRQEIQKSFYKGWDEANLKEPIAETKISVKDALIEMFNSNEYKNINDVNKHSYDITNYVNERSGQFVDTSTINKTFNEWYETKYKKPELITKAIYPITDEEKTLIKNKVESAYPHVKFRFQFPQKTHFNVIFDKGTVDISEISKTLGEGYRFIHNYGDENKDAPQYAKSAEEIKKPEPKIKQKIKSIQNDELNNAIDDYLTSFDLKEGIDPVQLAKGVKVVGIYTKLQVYKFADIVNDLYSKIGDKVKDIFDSLKQAYMAYRETAPKEIYDKMDASLRDYTYENSIGGQGDTEIQKDDTNVLGGQAQEGIQGTEGEGGTGQVRGGQGRRNVRSSAETNRQANAAKQRTGPEYSGRTGYSGSSPIDGSNNYRITDEDNIGQSFSVEVKVKENIEAIRTLKTLLKENRYATLEEKRKLVKYVGWGGIPQIFNEYDQKFEARHKELKELLTDKEYEAARASTINAHYTSPEIITSIYTALERFGFTGGRVLEPGLGIGHFFGLMPENMAMNSEFHGVELDDISTQIAQKLYPKATINQNENTGKGYQEIFFPHNYFDVVVSNVPFADIKIFDAVEPKSWWSKNKQSLHNFYFAKSIDKVKPGGIVAFITTHYTMDSLSPTLRRHLDDRADLIGAIRLPNNAFKKNANTEVVTDIIFLRRKDGNEFTGEEWLESESHSIKGQDVYYNQYFDANPDMVLGSHSTAGSMYRADEYTVLPTRESKTVGLQDLIDKAIQKLPSDIFNKAAGNNVDLTVKISKGVRYGSYVIKDNTLYQYTEDGLQIAETSNDKKQKIIQLVKIKEKLNEVIQRQFDTDNDAEVEDSIKELNSLYDNYVRKYEHLTHKSTKQLFKEDPDYPRLRALEIVDEETHIINKADILKKRIFNPIRTITKAESAKDALLVSLSEKGELDFPYMEELSGKTREQLLDELGDLVFLDPATQEYVTKDEYLSGDVKTKLLEAEQLAKTDQTFKKNVEALKQIQPEDVGYLDITAKLGSSWIPTSYYDQFIKELLDDPNLSLKVTYSTKTSNYFVKYNQWALRSNLKNTSDYGTDDFNAIELIKMALNHQSPKVYQEVIDPVTRSKRNVLDAAATEGAKAKQQLIKEKFNDWVFKEDKQRTELVSAFNEKLNRTVIRDFNGQHLTFPNLVKEKNGQPFILRPYQKDAIWRIIQNKTNMLAHAVGSGKTATMIISAMEMKRIGLIKKPIVVVPNHLVSQWQDEWLKLYPQAKTLAPDKSDYTPDKRKQLLSMIATNEWDGVIIPYSFFKMLDITDSYKEEYVNERIQELDLAIEELEQEGGGYGSPSTREIKNLEKQKQRLLEKLKEGEASIQREDIIGFNELGFDYLFVDEAHNFKNLYLPTKITNIRGIGRSNSDQANDLFMKVGWMKKHFGGNVTFATGTPVSNTLTEFFIMQRYLQPEALDDAGVYNLDSWIHSFGEIVSRLEITPQGTYRVNERLSKIDNFIELMKIYRQIADIQSKEDIEKYLELPEIDGGKPTVIKIKANDEIIDYWHSLARRAEWVKENPKEKQIDNMLKITGDGRKSSVDMRLIDPKFPDLPDSKLNTCVNKVVEVYNQEKERKGAQLIFLDEGTPTGDQFNLYADIKRKLIKKGVAEKEIAFIHDFDTQQAKSALFKRVNSGSVRVLIGSTQKMSEGMNVQERLAASHDLSVPWKPANIEQREGRSIRSGNTYKTVKLFRYVLEGVADNSGFDSYLWQILNTKARAFAAAMSRNLSVRTVEDSEAKALSYAETMAIATGNPLIFERINLESEVAKLDRLYGAFLQQRESLRRNRETYNYNLQENPDSIKRIGEIIPKLQEEFKITVGDKTFTGKDAKKEGGEALYETVAKLIAPNEYTKEDFVLDNYINSLSKENWAEITKKLSNKQIGKYYNYNLYIAAESFWTSDKVKIIALPENINIEKVKRDYNLQSVGISFNLSKIGGINSNHLDNLKADLEDLKNRLQKELDESKKQIIGIDERLKEPFDKMEEMRAKEKRLDEVNKLLEVTNEESAQQDDEEESGAGETNIIEPPDEDRFISDKLYNDSLNDIKNFSMTSGMEPKELKAYAIAGAYHLENLFKSAGEKADLYVPWYKQMIKQFGEKIRRHLRKIWHEAKNILSNAKNKIVEIGKTPAKETTFGMGLGQVIPNIRSSAEGTNERSKQNLVEENYGLSRTLKQSGNAPALKTLGQGTSNLAKGISEEGKKFMDQFTTPPPVKAQLDKKFKPFYDLAERRLNREYVGNQNEILRVTTNDFKDFRKLSRIDKEGLLEALEDYHHNYLYRGTFIATDIGIRGMTADEIVKKYSLNPAQELVLRQFDELGQATLELVKKGEKEMLFEFKKDISGLFTKEEFIEVLPQFSKYEEYMDAPLDNKVMNDVWNNDPLSRSKLADFAVERKYKDYGKYFYMNLSRPLEQGNWVVHIEKPLDPKAKDSQMKRIFTYFENEADAKQFYEDAKKEGWALKDRIAKVSELLKNQSDWGRLDQTTLLHLFNTSNIEIPKEVVDQLLKTVKEGYWDKHTIHRNYTPGLKWTAKETEQNIVNLLSESSAKRNKLYGIAKLNEMLTVLENEYGQKVREVGADENELARLKRTMEYTQKFLSGLKYANNNVLNSIRGIMYLWDLGFFRPSFMLQQTTENFQTVMPLAISEGGLSGESDFIKAGADTGKIALAIIEEKLYGRPKIDIDSKLWNMITKLRDMEKVSPLGVKVLFGESGDPKIHYDIVGKGFDAIKNTLSAGGQGIEYITRIHTAATFYRIAKRKGMTDIDKITNYVADMIDLSKANYAKTGTIVAVNPKQQRGYNEKSLGRMLANTYLVYKKWASANTGLYRYLWNRSKVAFLTKVMVGIGAGGMKKFPLIIGLYGIASLLMNLFNDDDDSDLDYKLLELENKLNEEVGGKIGSLLNRGAGTYFNVDLSGLMAQGSALPTDVLAPKIGNIKSIPQALYEAPRIVTESVMGRPYTFTTDIIGGVWGGVQLAKGGLDDKEKQRANKKFITALPSTIRSFYQSDIMDTEGLKYRNKTLIKPEDMTDEELRIKSWGFQPERFMKAYDELGKPKKRNPSLQGPILREPILREPTLREPVVRQQY